jgi:hypothetical protein
VLARSVGQVRDVLGCITDNGDLTMSYPTIAAAATALGGDNPLGTPAEPEQPGGRTRVIRARPPAGPGA